MGSSTLISQHLPAISLTAVRPAKEQSAVKNQPSKFLPYCSILYVKYVFGFNVSTED